MANYQITLVLRPELVVRSSSYPKSSRPLFIDFDCRNDRNLKISHNLPDSSPLSSMFHDEEDIAGWLIAAIAHYCRPPPLSASLAIGCLASYKGPKGILVYGLGYGSRLQTRSHKFVSATKCGEGYHNCKGRESKCR